MPIDARSSAAAGPPSFFLGLEFDRLDVEAMLDWLEAMRAQPGFRYVVTPNVDHIVKLYPRVEKPSTAPYRSAYADAALRLCDSRILQRLAALRGIHLPLCPGSTLTAAMMDRLLRSGDRVAIIGGTQAAVAQLRRLYPEPEFVQHIPPMGLLDKPAAVIDILRFLEQADADFTLLCVGSPQSEIIAARLAKAGTLRGTALCVGASINFLTGDARRAPPWMQQAGLEWLHRLLSEPRRMWRRYLVDDPRIFWLALTDGWRHGRR